MVPDVTDAAALTTVGGSAVTTGVPLSNFIRPSLCQVLCRCVTGFEIQCKTPLSISLLLLPVSSLPRLPMTLLPTKQATLTINYSSNLSLQSLSPGHLLNLFFVFLHGLGYQTSETAAPP